MSSGFSRLQTPGCSNFIATQLVRLCDANLDIPAWPLASLLSFLNPHPLSSLIYLQPGIQESSAGDTGSICSCSPPRHATLCWPPGQENKPLLFLSDFRLLFGLRSLPRYLPRYHFPSAALSSNLRVLHHNPHHGKGNSPHRNLAQLECLTMSTLLAL